MTMQKVFYPLTHPQKAIWYTEKTFPDTSIGNIAATIRFKGQIDYNLLEKAINLCIEKNDALRIRLIENDNEPLQYVAEYKYIKFSFYDFSKSEDVNELYQWDEKQTKTPFKLIDSDLIYFVLLKFSENEAGIYGKVHHTLTDSWGFQLIGNQIIEYYDGLKNGVPISDEKKPSYTDFVMDELSYLKSNKFSRDKTYWNDKYETFPEFTYFKPHNASLNYSISTRKTFILSDEISSKIKIFCECNHISVFTLIYTLVAIYIYRITSKNDIVFGTSVLNRKNVIDKNTVGMFVTTVPIRLNFDDQIEFRELIDIVSKGWMELLRHQRYPYDMLLRDYREKHKVTEGLYDVTISYHNAKLIKKGCFKDFAIRWHSYGYQAETLNIHINDREGKEQYIIDFDYLKALIDASDIENLYGYVFNLLEDAIQNPRKKIFELEILSDHEKKKLLYSFNNTNSEYPKEKTIHQLFEEQVNKTPDNIAVVFRDKKMTYRSLDEKANQLANYLINDECILPDMPIGVLIKNSIDQIIAILGVLKSGGAFVPIDPEIPDERKKSIIEDAEIQVVISSKNHIQFLNRLEWECKTFNSYLCLDCEDVYSVEEEQKNKLMNEELWQYVGGNAKDEITGGGWTNSYTGQPFSKEEMDEYGENILIKLKPYLNNETRVLEIGCASGISMYKIASCVGFYYGTDLSKVILDKNREFIARKGYTNIELEDLAAHEIDALSGQSFNVIILNSVIQCFHGYNYLRNVLLKAINLIDEKGIIFVGDVMDQNLKTDLIQSLLEFKSDHPQKEFKTKTDWSEELFIAKEFFEDFKSDYQEIKGLYFSKKIHTISNELTQFRYDVVIEINKKPSKKSLLIKNKHKSQYGSAQLKKHLLNRPLTKVSPNNLAYIIYTSGTSGKPKGVMLEHRALTNLAFWHNQYYSISPCDRATRYASPGFDASVWELFPYLIAGASVYVIDEDIRLDINRLNSYFETNKITVSFLPTQFCEQFMKIKNTSLRNLLTGGDKLKRYIKQDYKVINNYGPTEYTVVTTSYPVEGNEDKNIPIGKPIFNSKLYVVDKNNLLQPIGVPGELCISGDGLARGYLKSPELTETKFVNNPFVQGEKMYRTGDLVRWRPDGNVELLGRIDNQVKIRGFRIELEEIETKLLEYKSITAAIVINKRNQNEDGNLTAFYTSKKKVASLKLREYLRSILPDYMIPSKFIQLDKMPKLSNDKIDRKSLLDFTERTNRKKKKRQAKNEFVEIIIMVWEKVLNINGIGIDDNFYDLGGDSIKAIQICAELQKNQLSLNIQDLFENLTIKEVTNYIKRIDDKSDNINLEGDVRLSPIQKWFFTQKFSDTHHFNQSVFLYNKTGLKEEYVKKAFTKIIEHHDTLRITYKVQEGQVIQSYQKFTTDLHFFEMSDLRGHKEYPEIIKKQADLLQSSIDLANGPMIKVQLFKTIDGDYLLIVIHHLVIDGISWRILLEDFSEIYNFYINDEAVVIPNKTHSFKLWVDKLYGFANNNMLLKEKKYWAQIERTKTATIFQEKLVTENRNKDSTKITISLNKNETGSLLTKINRVYGTQISDILLTALGLTFKGFTSHSQFLINLEGHGRELVIENTNITRTVGWFTSYFPFILDISDSEDLSYQIKFVKESLRHIPNKGIGYGILRYITDKENRKGLSFNTDPEVNFNYLGQFDLPNDNFQILELFTGLSVSPNSERICPLDINGVIINGILKVEFNFNEKQLNKDSMAAIANDYKLNLRRLINHCLEKREPQITPSDLGDSKLSIEELGKIINHINSL